ncbi:uncharacterized protein CPUR_05407 [Claviceps purpurea 20.1]|uniref:Uncharacterized protein n=1 Tax=Claviceps purpurea (strain 20.1) TaxID=1111077 RepID=M1WG86_CLAP2|nr:uncharacterized protein CPUR_05407 [Claviceps purpurea 20.1]
MKHSTLENHINYSANCFV